MEQMVAEEKRKHQRYPREELPLRLFAANRDPLEDASVQDVSLRGLGFVASRRMEPGERFRFRLGSPGFGAVSGVAAVCWTSPTVNRTSFRYGARILTLHWGGARRLKKLINRGTLDTVDIVDRALTVACCIVLYKVLQHQGWIQPVVVGPFLEWAVGWMPFAVTIGGSLLAIMFYFM